jgi:hypothetical protein
MNRIGEVATYGDNLFQGAFLSKTNWSRIIHHLLPVCFLVYSDVWFLLILSRDFDQ